jgi:hypothetical protein
MAFSAALIEIAVRYSLFGKPAENVCAHRWDGLAIATATPEMVGEAFWNDVKAVMRGAVPNATDQVFFTEVFVKELGGGEVYGSYAIPTDERNGLRAAGSAASIMPAFVAGSVKLTVASSVTKPGGKRLSPLLDGDVGANQVLDTDILEALDDWGNMWANPHALGAPVATGVLYPVIARKDTDGTVLTYQDVTGYVVRNKVSSQLTRKDKRGT